MFHKLFKRGVSEQKSRAWTFGIMLAFSIAGLISAFVLTVEKIHLLENPHAQLSCSVNLVINCATVMQTWQSHVFGFPNSLIGLIGYSAGVAFALIALSRVVLARWVMLSAQIVSLLGVVFAYWLFFQSVYVIEVLCPWCLVVTVSTTMIFAAITHENLRRNTFGLSSSVQKKVEKFMAGGYDKLLTASWIVFLVALVILKFGESLLA